MMNKLDEFFMSNNWQYGGEGQGDWEYVGDIDPQEAAKELKQLHAELDKAIAWHEGDDSPHAKLDQEISQLLAKNKAMRNALEELEMAEYSHRCDKELEELRTENKILTEVVDKLMKAIQRASRKILDDYQAKE
jgi:hypothetical protein